MAEENLDGSNAGDLPENTNPPEIQEPENDLAVSEEKKWPGWPGDNVFRLLVPSQKVGGIIGRKGEFIKKMCEETKARIKILDGPPSSSERTVLVSAKEEPDLAVPPAMDGLLRVHKRVVDVDSESAQAPTGPRTVCARLLVAATQAGSLIGKQGSTIKSIQDGSACTIRVLSGENLPPFALPDDSIVEVQGEAAGVHKAIEMIAGHLRKFLVDHGIISVFEMQMQMPDACGNQNIPPRQDWGPPPQGFPMNSGGGPGFTPNSQYMPPPHEFDNYYPPMDMPPLDNKYPRQGPPSYGRDAAMGGYTSGAPPQQSVVTKVTQTMQIPLSYADAVIGASGANISYVRRASGASIAIQETRGVPGEMTVEINGSASQVQTAQQMIQNSIAEAASAAQNPGGQPQPPPPGHSYYPSSQGGPDYGAPPDGHMGHHPPPPGAADYGAEYGAMYGSTGGYGSHNYGY